MDNEQLTASLRLKKIRKYLGKTQIQMAIALKTSQSYLSAIERGEKDLSRSLLVNLARELPGLNVNWLLTGDGEMLNDPEAVEAEMSPNPSHLSIDFVHLSGKNQVEEPSTTYASREDEIVYLRMYISYLEQFIYQKHPDYRPPEWRKKQG
jgi:transcriptional regulator with XRE-family HTH domain